MSDETEPDNRPNTQDGAGLELAVTKEVVSLAEINLKVSVPGDEVTGRIQKAIDATMKQVRLPGFRPGHIPRRVVVERFGSTITSEIVQEVLQEAYKQALQESGLEPISPGEMSEVNYHPGQPLEFTVKVETAPEIAVPNLSEVTVELPQPHVGEEDVTLALDNLRESQAALVPTEENVSTDSVVTFDVQEIDKTGVPIVGRTQKDVELDLSRSRPGDPFTSQLIGLKAGDSAMIDAPKREQASGQQPPEIGRLKVEITNVRRKELPELTDEFAKTINPSAESLDAMKTDLKRYLEARAAHKAREQMFRSIVDDLLRKTDFSVPPSMLERYLNDLANDAIHSEEEHHHGHDHKHDHDPKKIEHFKEEYRASAIWNLRWFLLRKRLIKEYNLEVSDEEQRKEVEQLAHIEGKTFAEFEKKLTDEQKKRIREDLLERKVFALLEREVNVIPKPVTLAEFEGRDKAESRLVTV
jgi:trigger factor